ncbi:MAG: hypothetical protein QG663_363 [Thermodesulfobacteriota bacterium]|nr:hypothetical protein [Thermodesulfobacteriota bacterium]
MIQTKNAISDISEQAREELNENDLTPGQLKWLETSKKIGPGSITPTERQTLEKLYAELLPQEQQELFDYIKSRFGKDNETETEQGDDPVTRMERMVWSTPSDSLKSSFRKAQIPKTPPRK